MRIALLHTVVVLGLTVGCTQPQRVSQQEPGVKLAPTGSGLASGGGFRPELQKPGSASPGTPPGGPTVAPTTTNSAAGLKETKAKATEPSTPFALTTAEPLSPWAPGDFTVAVLPDTQMYTAVRKGGQPEMLVAQIEWILSNRLSRNIVYVTTEGDISNDGNKIPQQWLRATNALYRLENPARTGSPDGLRWSAVVGNHDTRSGGTVLFNKFLGTNHFAGRSYYGGHYGTNNDSHYDLFSASGQDFVVLALTMGAGSDTNLMRWANGVLNANANRQAIVVTHSLLGPRAWPHPAPWTKEGLRLFPALTNNPNLFLMLCGHRHGEGRRHEVLGNGQGVDVVLSDYQNYTNGGNGFMRLMEFSPRNQTIRVKTFSPWTKQWTTNTDGHFSLAWTLPGRSPTQRFCPAGP
jgi:hypothetical protein